MTRREARHYPVRSAGGLLDPTLWYGSTECLLRERADFLMQGQGVFMQIDGSAESMLFNSKEGAEWYAEAQLNRCRTAVELR